MYSVTRMNSRYGSPRIRPCDPVTDMHPTQTFHLFESGLRDLYWAEGVLARALTKMIWHTRTEELMSNLVSYARERQRHLGRLEDVFRQLRKKTSGTKSIPADSLIRQALLDMEKCEEGLMRDASIIISLQKILNYEIATYLTLKQLAETLELPEVVDLLGTCLAEEKNANERLTEVGMAIAYASSADGVIG